MSTRRILIFLSLLLACAGVFSQSQTENFIRVRTFLSADSSAWRDKIVYFDDMGREEQTVLTGASPSGGDIVTLKEYDGYGRLEKTWNGAAVSGNSGGHVDIGTLKALAVQSNGNDSKPYALTVYEPSPLDRPLRQYGAGSGWHQHDRYAGTSYHTNVTGDRRLDCIRFTATQAAGSAGVTVTHSGSYATGSLSVECRTGEDRDTTYEFRDLNGETVLSRRILDGRNLDTYYYDYRGRVIQTQGGSHDGSHESEYSGYDFSGNTTSRKLTHGGYYTQLYMYAYDGWGRLTEKRHKYNGGDWVTLADNSYDPLGRLSVNRRNGVNSNKTEYTYNVRSWPTAIQGSHFSQTLYYNTVPAGLAAVPRYGGSVSAMEWEQNAETHSNSFSYDGLDRIASSSYGNTLGMDGYFDTEYEYDDHGNLTYIGRYAQSATENLYEKVDDLSLTYDGNRLTDISQGGDADDFWDYVPYGSPAAVSGQCTYDQNGNMTSNRLKGIAAVTYNLLNLPEQVAFTDGSTASYCYDMTGAKRRVTYSTASSTLEQPVASAMQTEAGTGAQSASQSAAVSTMVDYCGSLIFHGSQEYIRLEDDGIWSSSGGYCFYIKDHLGNVRSVNNLTGSSVQTSQYYPFGKMWDDLSWGSGSTQPFRYGGKELDKMHGLDWYDFGARMYDPGIGRFMSMDKEAEKYYPYSPYTYCLNNPIKNIDPDGRAVETIWDAANVVMDATSLVTNVASGNLLSAAVDAGALLVDVAATSVPFVPGGAGTAVKAYRSANTFKTNIKAGREFEKSVINATRKEGRNIFTQTTVVPKNGVGNVKGNRSKIDMLEKNKDGTYTASEIKLSPRSKLSKGQKTTEKHVKTGNQIFEVRSQKGGLRKGDEIKITNYQRIYEQSK